MAPRRHLFFYLCLLLLGQSGCNNTTGNPALQAETGVPSPTAQTLSPNPAAKKTQYPELDLFDGREQEAETSAPLEYKGFQIRRKTKKVLIEETTKPTELSYAQVLRKRKVLITLDGVAHPMGNETRFGLFAFLSPDSKQLLVQQDAWRTTRQWIISLEKQLRVLIDSRDYRLERFGAIDLDRDGQFELVGYQKYWGFEFLRGLTYSSADSPEIRIVFGYDAKTQKYDPANPRFKSYLLERVEEIKSRFEGTDGRARNGYSLMQRMSDVMDGTMTLALVGEEKAAWEFLERYCPAEKPEEKEDAKSRIRFAIRENIIYKILKRNHRL